MDKKQSIQHYEANKANVPMNTVRLQNIFFHVTKACNLRCKYCYFSATKPLPDEMAAEEFTLLWPEIVNIRPQKVIFTGGEPLLRPDILNLLHGLKNADPEHHVLRCLNSNGHLVTPRLAQALVGLADEVRVSLDAMSVRNDALRGKGNFEAAIKALETYYAVGFEPKVLITVTEYSLPDLEDLLQFLIQERFTRININIFRPIGRGSNHQEWVVNIDEVRTIVKQVWAKCYPDQFLLPEVTKPSACTKCGVGSFLNIMPNGDVFPCHVLTNREFRCGNVREQSLIDICRRTGLLGQLKALDFQELAQQDDRLELLAKPSCMGEIYAETRSSPIWKNSIPLLNIE